MNLIHAPGYSIRVVTPPSSETAPRSEIEIAGAPTGKFVQGAVLEAALKWNNYLLLFLTDDIPFEEGLNIYLLDGNLDVVDSAQMYHIYSTGVFSDLDLTQADTARFRFFAEVVWTLQLFPQKVFALPILSDPIGVHRPFGFFRMFKIYRRSVPDLGKDETAVAATVSLGDG